MPQPHKISIGFDPGGIERLQHLTKTLESTQREVIAALIGLPDEDILNAIAAYRERKEQKKREARVMRTVARMSAEQLIAIKDEIMKREAQQ